MCSASVARVRYAYCPIGALSKLPTICTATVSPVTYRAHALKNSIRRTGCPFWPRWGRPWAGRACSARVCSTRARATSTPEACPSGRGLLQSALFAWSAHCRGASPRSWELEQLCKACTTSSLCPFGARYVIAQRADLVGVDSCHEETTIPALQDLASEFLA